MTAPEDVARVIATLIEPSEAMLHALAARMWAVLEAQERGEYGQAELTRRRESIWAEARALGCQRDLECVLTAQRTERMGGRTR